MFRSKIAPTVGLVHTKLKERDIGPPISRRSLSRLLRRIGYRYKAIDDRVHLIEQLHLRDWRRRFIQRLNENKSSSFPRPVIYLDESWINCNDSAKKGWVPKVMKTRHDKLSHTLRKKSGKGTRLIMLHAGSDRGFVPGALLIKSSITASEDYHQEMDGFGFENWFRQNLLPNIPYNSIIVMDNASYHSLSDIPKSNDRVAVMKKWLQDKNISYPQKAVKKEVKKKKLGKKRINLFPYSFPFNP